MEAVAMAPQDAFEGLLGGLRDFYASTVEQLVKENASLSAELARLRPPLVHIDASDVSANTTFDVHSCLRPHERFLPEPSHSTGLSPGRNQSGRLPSPLKVDTDGPGHGRGVPDALGSPLSPLAGAATPNFGEPQQSQGIGVSSGEGEGPDRFTRAIARVQTSSSGRGSFSKLRKTGRAPHIGESTGSRRQNCLAQCTPSLTSAVQHLYFDIFCAVVIMVNGITLGVDVQTSSEGRDVPFVIRALDVIIIAWYIVELMLRVWADRWRRNRLWNFFDFWMIVAALINIAVDVEDIPKRYHVVRFLRFMRLLRVLKVLKLGKTVNTYFIVFSKMTFSLSQSMPSLLSAAMVIVFFTYITAVMLTQTATDYREDSSSDHSVLAEHYGSLDRTFYSLVKSIFNGQAWGELMQPLTHVSFVATFVFMTYLMLTLLCLLNVIHGVFVDSALQSTAHYKELMVAEAQKKRIMLVQHLKDVFREIDSDNSGFITVAEFDACLSTPGGRAFFEVMGLSTVQAYQLFRLIDADSSESVDIDEFCEGCIRFMGEAKNFDIQCLLIENKQMLSHWSAFLDAFERGSREPGPDFHCGPAGSKKSSARSGASESRVSAPPALSGGETKLDMLNEFMQHQQDVSSANDASDVVNFESPALTPTEANGKAIELKVSASDKLVEPRREGITRIKGPADGPHAPPAIPREKRSL
mmetsp:Transcript_49608/g.91542  ORF Transcript_49608/g.91542 Transcript_49608/m.91542 type:complete len:696 (+) Transcript_49608:26-2113(+)